MSGTHQFSRRWVISSRWPPKLQRESSGVIWLTLSPPTPTQFGVPRIAPTVLAMEMAPRWRKR
eukprot:7844437-Pyramimonas_sp.AAC.1